MLVIMNILLLGLIEIGQLWRMETNVLRRQQLMGELKELILTIFCHVVGVGLVG